MGTVERMKYAVNFSDLSQKEICSPFYVSFGSLQQSHACQYYKITKQTCTVTIDESGGVVERIRLKDKTFSDLIFFYSFVTNFDGHIVDY